MEEVRRLLVMRYVESKRWDWAGARQALRSRAQYAGARRPIGFRAPLDGLTGGIAARL